MAQAYDFALEKIGMDIQSYSIWNDYVSFLKSVEAIGSYAENQKISAVRKVFTVVSMLYNFIKFKYVHNIFLLKFVDLFTIKCK